MLIVDFDAAFKKETAIMMMMAVKKMRIEEGFIFYFGIFFFKVFFF